MKTAVVSYIYPAGVKFLQPFLQSLSAQSVQDFELVLFNDGVHNLHQLLQGYHQPFQIFPVQGSVVAIRYHSFATLAATDFDAFVFQDIDDRMSDNRVEISRNLLQSYPMVCNDLQLVNQSDAVINRAAWSLRLPDGFAFNHTFITDKNIAGLGSTAIKKELLLQPIRFHETPLAADWFLFYQLLYHSGATALFTSACHSIYLQHDNNIAGIKEVQASRLLHVMDVCKRHYNALIDTGHKWVAPHLQDVLIKEALILKQNYIYQSPVNDLNLFWWEEKNYLYEKI